MSEQTHVQPGYSMPPPWREPRELKPGWRKAGRALLLVLGSIAAFVLLAVLAAIVWLHTGKGAEELGRFVAHEARLAIEGDLKVGEIRVGGFLHLCAEGAELRDPDGHKVLAAESICVDLSPLALKAHRVKASKVRLEKPWVEIAAVPGPTPGTQTTTLARALAPRKVQQKTASGPFEWVIDVRDLQLRGGAVAIRPGVGEPATFALEDLDIAQAHAIYSAASSAAALKLSAELAAPGRAPLALDLDATVDGAPMSGKAALTQLRFKLGESTLVLNGSWDLARQAGELRLRELVLLPRDVAQLTPVREGRPPQPAPIAGEVRGQADLRSDGKTAQLEVHLQAGGGRIDAKATGTLEKDPVWDLQLALEAVDPGAVSPLAPKGQVSARVSLHGKGRPRFDEHGIQGDLRGNVHLGPAQLDRVGPIVADFEARLEGRSALIKAFSATALGLQIKAHGTAARDDLALDLDVDAKDLSHVGRAVGALTRKPSLPLAGALQLSARLTGSPRSPDARVRLRAPRLRWAPTVVAEGLAVDGTLHGPLRAPDGSLRLDAKRLSVSNIDLGAPRVDMGLQWPIAHLRIDAGVQDGAMSVAGDARIDQDKDGLVLSNFIVAYPGNQFHLSRDANVHFREEVVVEPLELVSDHGSLRVSAQLWPQTAREQARVEAALVVSRLELDRLPQFALPKDLGLHGVVDANAVVNGPQAKPDLDLRADLKGAGAKPAGALDIDAHTHAHLHGGRLQTDGWIASPGILRFSFDGELPAESLAQQPSNAPIKLEARLEQVDLAKLAATGRIASLERARVHGLVDLRISAAGTLAQPRATVAFAGQNVGTQSVHDVDARAGLLLDKSRIAFDGGVALQGAEALGLTASAPFDLLKALRDPAYLRGMMQRPVKADLVVTQLPLERAAQAGLLPAGSAGIVSLSLRLEGTPAQPQLALSSSGTGVSVGRLHGLAFQAELGVTDQVKLVAGAQAQGDTVARLEAKAALSGGEILELVERRNDPQALTPLFDRVVSMTLEIPGLPIARASQLAGQKQAMAEGRVVGRVVLSGTPARPHLTGRITLRDLTSQKSKLGAADVYLEADAAGALLHVGIDPPGGGNFLAHAQLQADLGGRTLLRRGAMSVLDGQLKGEVQAKQLDLAFLSGLLPNVRRAGGTLQGDVKLAGVLAKPQAEGNAHLRRGLFDVVGQGVYEDVGLDATFSPKEVVVDRLTGNTGTGTYSAVLSASRKSQGDGTDSVQFTGEVHLGDGESVRDRKRPDGTPLRAGAVPVRQAGEERMDIGGELDLFGDYTGDLLTVNVKIPDAHVDVRQLPDKKLPGMKPNPDVLLVHPGEKPHPPGMEPEEVEAEQRALATAAFRMHAHLELNHLYVKAADFEFPVESDLQFDYDARHPDEPTADGTVHVPAGSFTALGRRFVIEDAKIIETGGEIDDPELDVRARYDNPKATVTIHVAGTAKDPLIDMSSNPPMDQDAIAFFLATGRVQGHATQQGGGVDLSGAATSVLGSILFGQVRKELASVLPVDVLTIESNSLGVSTASIGKYIGDRVYIGYRQQFTPVQYENSSEGRIEYEISKQVTAEATIGDKTKDVSVLWTKDF
ncbi:MAG: hypothetical protein E6J78_18030 [Deltaproteobacteria bacterium]|nr:MAG: hypothetical protein E6J78_18030 [Deltaproteobacteria bacterium]